MNDNTYWYGWTTDVSNTDVGQTGVAYSLSEANNMHVNWEVDGTGWRSHGMEWDLMPTAQGLSAEYCDVSYLKQYPNKNGYEKYSRKASVVMKMNPGGRSVAGMHTSSSEASTGNIHIQLTGAATSEGKLPYCFCETTDTQVLRIQHMQALVSTAHLIPTDIFLRGCRLEPLSV